MASETSRQSACSRTSSTNSDVRIDEFVKIKIGEVKNLQKANSKASETIRDAACTINLDQEEIFRTATIHNTNNPFFNEEFSFDIPKPFRYLNVYLYDTSESSQIKKPNPFPSSVRQAIGKVAIHKDDIHRLHGKDQWLPITPVTPESEVNGALSIEIIRNPIDEDIIAVKINQCTNLLAVKETCNAFAEVSIVPRPGDPPIMTSRTKTIKKSTCPDFGDVLNFSFKKVLTKQRSCPESDSREESAWKLAGVNVVLWHESPFGNVFLGSVNIYLGALNWTSFCHKGWYYLQPRTNCEGAVGSMRLFIRHAADKVIPGDHYEPLKKLLLESVEGKIPCCSSSVYILGELCTLQDRPDTARPIVRFFVNQNRLVDLVEILSDEEMRSATTDVNTLFRGNSFLIKIVDETMKLYKFYLHDTLRDHIDRIYKENKNCEINLNKLECANELQSNLSCLITYVKEIFTTITQSAIYCPPLISEVLYAIKKRAYRHWPDRPEVMSTVVCAFILLRFFAAALLNPKLFGFNVPQGSPPPNVMRTLTLVSKSVQTLGNTLSNVAPLPKATVHKEEYMQPIFDMFCKSPYLDQMRHFLHQVSTPTNPIPKQLSDSWCKAGEFSSTDSALRTSLSSHELFSSPINAIPDSKRYKKLHALEASKCLVRKRAHAADNFKCTKSDSEELSMSADDAVRYRAMSAQENENLNKYGRIEQNLSRSETDFRIKEYRRFVDRPIVLKEGLMIKRGQSRHFLNMIPGFRNYKHLYFRLTTYDLTYGKSKRLAAERPLMRIPVEKIIDVQMVAEEKAYNNLTNMIKIVQRDSVLFVQALSCVEQKQWYDTLSFAVRRSQLRGDNMPRSNTEWFIACCGEGEFSAISQSSGFGSAGNNDVILDHMEIDIDRELEKIHTMFLSKMEKVKAYVAEEEAKCGGGMCRTVCSTVIESVNSDSVDVGPVGDSSENEVFLDADEQVGDERNVKRCASALSSAGSGVSSCCDKSEGSESSDKRVLHDKMFLKPHCHHHNIVCAGVGKEVLSAQEAGNLNKLYCDSEILAKVSNLSVGGRSSKISGNGFSKNVGNRSRLISLYKIKQITEDLESFHKTYVTKLQQKQKYGSKSFPIETDAWGLARRQGFSNWTCGSVSSDNESDIEQGSSITDHTFRRASEPVKTMKLSISAKDIECCSKDNNTKAGGKQNKCESDSTQVFKKRWCSWNKKNFV